ncbi:hypothetical protein MNBD_ALPHA07-2261 [hydrothermal vent metagenome]|uniref:Uncharacterized protein n=1 Tax=hydrothermal vent metagenome TaxID=652676 RepID=A0A3B0R8B4_9ZZZZ
MNWWLVVSNMKHGMLTVIPAGDDMADHSRHSAPTGHADENTDDNAGDHGDHNSGDQPGAGVIFLATLMSFAILFAGLWLTGVFF